MAFIQPKKNVENNIKIEDEFQVSSILGPGPWIWGSGVREGDVDLAAMIYKKNECKPPAFALLSDRLSFHFFIFF